MRELANSVTIMAIAIAIAACGGHHYDASEAHAITTSAVAVGDRAPSSTLTDASGHPVALATIIGAHERTIVTFYRGFY